MAEPRCDTGLWIACWGDPKPGDPAPLSGQAAVFLLVAALVISVLWIWLSERAERNRGRQ